MLDIYVATVYVVTRYVVRLYQLIAKYVHTYGTYAKLAASRRVVCLIQHNQQHTKTHATRVAVNVSNRQPLLFDIRCRRFNLQNNIY